MKDALVPIDKAGRIVLPKEVREELAINPGDLLELSVQGDQVTLRPNREKTGFIKRGKALVYSTGGPDLLENEVVENIRGSERDSLKLNVAKDLPDQKRR
jgi:AbrB family looped-hinge helix DNA binding protein